MPLLSVLTSAYAPTATYLPDTIDSVKQQVLPDGWDLEWVVQEDGDQPRLRDHFFGLDFVRHAVNGRQMDLAYTRNLGLGRVRGDLVQVLDHDDILLPGALATMVAAFEAHPIHWAIGQADDLLPTGERVSWDSALPFGVLPAGSVNDWALDHGGNWPIHCAGLTIRTTTLRAVGGWAGVPIDDDVTMFAALAEVGDGYNEPTVTWLYRHHPQQTHKSAAWKAHSADGRRIALHRVAALRAVRSRLDPAPVGFPDSPDPAAPVEVGPLDPRKLRHETRED